MNLETLLTSPLGCNIPAASPVQRAGARVARGLPLDELRDDPEVLAAFGGREAVEALPSERGIMPEEFYNAASPRTAKTTLAVANAIVAGQTVDTSSLGPGEIPRVSILSLTLDVADVPFRRLVGIVDASPVLSPLVLERGSDSIMMRHPSGRPIEIAVVAGSKAAGGLVARWSGGLIADEATRMHSAADGAVANLDDALSAIRERLLPGAQIQGIGSPHAPRGTMYQLVQEYFGKPTDSIVVMRTTGPAGNPSYWTPERLERLRLKDLNAYRIVNDGEFLDPESGLASPISVRKNTREGPLELVPEHDAEYGAAVDTGEDRLTLVVVEAYHSADDDEAGGDLPYFRVAMAHEIRGGTPDTRWQDVARRCHHYAIDVASVDQYAASANAAIAERYGLTLDVTPWGASNRLEAFTTFATLLHADRIELPPHRQFRSDILAVKKRLTQTGATIVLPSTRDGRHSDFAPALAAAIRTAAQVANIDTDLSIGGYSAGLLGDQQTMDGWGAARTEHLRHSRILEQLPRRDARGRPYHYIIDHGDSAA